MNFRREPQNPDDETEDEAWATQGHTMVKVQILEGTAKAANAGRDGSKQDDGKEVLHALYSTFASVLRRTPRISSSGFKTS